MDSFQAMKGEFSKTVTSHSVMGANQAAHAYIIQDEKGNVLKTNGVLDSLVRGGKGNLADIEFHECKSLLYACKEAYAQKAPTVEFMLLTDNHNVFCWVNLRKQPTKLSCAGMVQQIRSMLGDPEFHATVGWCSRIANHATNLLASHPLREANILNLPVGKVDLEKLPPCQGFDRAIEEDKLGKPRYQIMEHRKKASISDSNSKST